MAEEVKEEKKVNHDEFTETAKALVANKYADLVGLEIDISNLYVVWKCKILEHAKCLIASDLLDDRYFEVTYNGKRKEFYVDSYVKENNSCVRKYVDF